MVGLRALAALSFAFACLAGPAFAQDTIQPGTKISVAAAKKQADGTLQTPRITCGRNGEGPAF